MSKLFIRDRVRLIFAALFCSAEKVQEIAANVSYEDEDEYNNVDGCGGEFAPIVSLQMPQHKSQLKKRMM